MSDTKTMLDRLESLRGANPEIRFVLDVSRLSLVIRVSHDNPATRIRETWRTWIDNLATREGDFDFVDLELDKLIERANAVIVNPAGLVRCNVGTRNVQCGLPAGHVGDHTALIPSDAPWFPRENDDSEPELGEGGHE